MSTKQTLTFVLSCLLLASCSASRSTKRAQAITGTKTEKFDSQYAGPKKRIGVVDFQNKTAYGQARLGTAASDILITELAKTGRFVVIERDKMDKIMDEQKFDLTGAVDPDTAVKMGKILGLQAIVTGAVSQFGVKTSGSDYLIVQSKKQLAECTIDVRLVDAETGAVLYADSGKGVSKTGTGSFLGMGTRGGYDETMEGEALRAAIVELVDNIVSQVDKKPWSCRIAEVDGDNIYIDAGLQSGIKE
ncbi:MAG: CsgG/HfaB family protein [Elusimicrobiota bacterium]